MQNRHLSFFALAKFLHHHLLWFLIGAYALAAVFPTPGSWMRNLSFGNIQIMQTNIHASLLLVLLALLMFNAGLGVKTSHLQSLRHKTGVLLAGLTANLAVPIAYIFVVTLVMRFWYEPDEAQHILVGLALVAAMPIAGSSTAWAQNSNGNLALSLGLVLCSTILSPIITPITLYLFGEMASDEYETVLESLAAYGSGAFLGFWIVLPSVLGLCARGALPESKLLAAMPFIKLSNCVVLLLLNYSNASASLPQALAARDFDFLGVTLGITAGLCLIAFASGYGLSCLFKVDDAERVSLMYGLGMNNSGTGLVLASLALASHPK
ncbi:MAG: bile acid:sodium symporter [Nitrospiraceae bacterium]